MSIVFSKYPYVQKFAIATGIVFGLCLSGCSPSENVSESPVQEIGDTAQNPNRKNKKVILTTFTVLADMARNVAGDKAIVESLTKPGGGDSRL